MQPRGGARIAADRKQRLVGALPGSKVCSAAETSLPPAPVRWFEPCAISAAIDHPGVEHGSGGDHGGR